MSPGLGLAEDCCERLGQFMRHAAGHLAQGVDPRGMGEAGVLGAQPGLGFRLPRPKQLAKAENGEQVQDGGEHCCGQQAGRWQQVSQTGRYSSRKDQRLRGTAEFFFELHACGWAAAHQGGSIGQVQVSQHRRA